MGTGCGWMTRQRINKLTFFLLLVGLVSSLIIYLTAPPVQRDPMLGDVLADKKYTHQLKQLGGEANVQAAEFQDWFAGLWHGEALARTVAVLTVVVTIGLRFVALHPDLDPAAEEKGNAPPSGG